MIQRQDIIVVSVAVVAIGASLLAQASNRTQVSEADYACATLGATYNVALRDGRFLPSAVALKRCDRLLFTNQDARSYRLAVGKHESHIDYPGFYLSTLAPNKTQEFIGAKSGEYQIHDHLSDQDTLKLTIAN